MKNTIIIIIIIISDCHQHLTPVEHAERLFPKQCLH